MQRNVPERAVRPPGLDDHRRAFVASAVAIRAKLIDPDRCLVQYRIPQAQLQRVLEQGGPAAGVDRNRGVNVAVHAVAGADTYAFRAAPLEQHFRHANALMNGHAVGTSVVQEQFVDSLRTTCHVCKHSCGLLSQE